MYKIYSEHFVLPPGFTKKLIRVMKLTTFLLFIAFMQVSAATLAQKVTLSENHASLTTVLTEIKKQTGYDFAITGTVLEKAKPVTINVKNEELSDVLKQMFENQPLDYKIEDKSVTVSIKTPTVIDKIKSALNLDKITVTGHIVDERGQPLAGATITIKGTSNSTTSDLYGNFMLKKVQPDATIVITFLGYDKKELPAKENMEVIKLDIASNPLSEVKVMAYSRESERLSVNNAVTIKGDDIAKQPVNNPLLALQGRVPGLVISPATGVAGSSITVRVHGQSSINSANYPLFVVDGVPYPSNPLQTANIGSSILGPSEGGGSGSSLSYINPADIESISVLSDADATAIYGSRAANGALVITTKRGKAGPTQITADFQQGWGRNTHFLDLMNTQQYLQMRHEALKNDGITTPSLYDFDINGLWDTTRYTNWQKKLIGGTAQYTNANLSISGGNATTQYLVGGTYNRQSTVFPGDYADQKGSLHFNINSTSANQRFRMQLTGSYLFDSNRLPPFNPTGLALSLAPDAPAEYNSDGSINWAPYQGGSDSWYGANPAAQFLQSYQAKTNNLVANAVLGYQIIDGLNLQVSTGYTNVQTNELAQAPLNYSDPDYIALVGTAARSASYSSNSNSSWIIEPQITFKHQIGKGKLDVLAGGTINQQNYNGLNQSGQDYLSDALLPNLAAAATKYVNSSTQGMYRYDAIFGRLSYNLQDKYLVSLNARRDGSSRFGSANEFHDFWSIGAGWIFSEEKFIKDHVPFMSFGKLKANYGTTGNDGIGDYRYLSIYNVVSYPVPYQGTSGLISTGLPNPYLQWEETHKLLVGIDLGFLKDRILVGANYTRNRSSNELVGFNLPSITGFTGIIENLPALIQNTDWEFTLSTVNIKGKDFKWTSGFNLTLPQNKLLAYPDLIPGGGYIIGQPLGLTRLFHFLGVDPATGLYQFADSQGNSTSNPNPVTDKSVIRNVGFPKYYGGFQNDFSYKRLSLDMFFQFVSQIKYNGLFSGLGPPGTSNNNQMAFVLNRWQHPGDDASFQRFNSNYSAYASWADAGASDAAYSNASFIRLKSLSLAYNFPENLLKRAGIQTTSIYIHGENLLTFTPFKGLDPETGTLPPLKIFTVGIKLGL
jgi:TonB-linked SusC/RagA family outer membrane protein